MKVYVYDIEVFKKDWIVVFSSTDGKEVKVIHNNNAELSHFMYRSDVMFCGFNNKHYDDWVVMTMLNGGDVDTVKAHNDFIINGGNGWEFESVQYQKKPFYSFDLRDDIADQGLSLKAIEGNINEPIVESSIPFDYPDKLSKEQLDEVIYYCKTDVANTVKLYHLRKDYLEGKIAVGKLRGWDETVSLPLTNPKLTALFLDAKPKNYDDEFEYTPPPELKLEKYTEPLEFYKTVDYEQKLVYPIAGLEQTYAWGGIHSAIPHYFDETTEKEKIVDIDVGSYYPTLALNYSYISRSIPSAKGYRDVYERRLEAKHQGNDEVAGALKLVLNSTYGAMKNKYNPLYDPHGCNHICITGQLLLTMIVERLEVVKGFKLIQTNTDGLMIKYPVRAEKQVNKIVEQFEKETHLSFEYTEIKKIAQKDVNNYIMTVGETYLIKDGVKTVTKPDKNKIATKGGWVSLWNGGSFKNNSLVIVHKALVNYFMFNKPVEETINEATNIFDFQMICKTGRTFDRTVWEHDGTFEEVQRVNRVYAVADESKGQLFKCKGNSKTTIADVPEHSYVDNENQLTIDQIDRTFYINLAKKRVDDYKGSAEPKKIKKKEVKKMATAQKLNLYQKLTKARKKFIEEGSKKTGANFSVGYEFFELKDIVPKATEIFDEMGLFFQCTFVGISAIGRMYDAENPEFPPVEFTFDINKMTPIFNKAGKPLQTEPQLVGCEITYYRRYLYMLALDIVEHDKIEPLTRKDENLSEVKENVAEVKPAKPATPEERQEAVEKMTGGTITAVQIKSIKAGLTELRNVCPDGIYENYIAEVVTKIKEKKISTKEADDILIEIGDAIEVEKGKAKND